MTNSLRRTLLLALGAWAIPGMACAGIVSPFAANAQGGTPAAGFVPPPARHSPVPPIIRLPSYTPPPSQPTNGQASSSALSATGFTPVPQHQTTASPFPAATTPSKALPPPLSPDVVYHNRALSSHLPSVPANFPAAPAPQMDELSAKDLTGPNLVHTTGAEVYVGPHSTANIVLPVSGFSPNMLSTPFHHPFLFTAQSKKILQFSVIGSKVIVSITPSFPVGAILTGKQPGDPAVTLTLLPKKIPARVYRIHIAGWHPNPAHHSSELSNSSRNQHLLSVMDAAARDQIPQGYSRVNRLPAIQVIGQNRYTPTIRYDSSGHSLTIYRITNTSSNPEQLVESDFYHPGVVAVAFWPSGKLFGHGTTKLFLISRLAHPAHSAIGFLGKE